MQLIALNTADMYVMNEDYYDKTLMYVLHHIVTYIIYTFITFSISSHLFEKSQLSLIRDYPSSDDLSIKLVSITNTSDGETTLSMDIGYSYNWVDATVIAITHEVDLFLFKFMVR